MEVIVEIIVYLFLEALVGVIGEMVVALGFYSLDRRTKGRALGRIFTALVFVAPAMLLGYLSLSFIPKMGFPNAGVAAAYFLLAPIFAGLSLCFLYWLINRGIERVPLFQITQFSHGVIFILVFSLTRALFG